MVKTLCDLASGVQDRLLERNRIFEEFFAATGPPARAGLPRNVRSLPPRRAAARVWTRALRDRRAARLGRVRPSDHRRQTRIAGLGSVASFPSLAGRDPSAGGYRHGIRPSRRRRGSRRMRSTAANAARCHDVRAAGQRRLLRAPAPRSESVHPSGTDGDSVSHAMGNSPRFLRAPRTRVRRRRLRIPLSISGRGEAGDWRYRRRGCRRRFESRLGRTRTCARKWPARNPNRSSMPRAPSISA